MAGGHGSDVNRCRGDHADQQDETETERGERDVCARGADRVADHAQSQADAAPVEHRVERPVGEFVEGYVEDLGESEHAEPAGAQEGNRNYFRRGNVLAQGFAQYEIWTGERAPEADMRRAVISALERGRKSRTAPLVTVVAGKKLRIAVELPRSK